MLRLTIMSCKSCSCRSTACIFATLVLHCPVRLQSLSIVACTMLSTLSRNTARLAVRQVARRQNVAAAASVGALNQREKHTLVLIRYDPGVVFTVSTMQYIERHCTVQPSAVVSVQFGSLRALCFESRCWIRRSTYCFECNTWVSRMSYLTSILLSFLFASSA